MNDDNNAITNAKTDYEKVSTNFVFVNNNIENLRSRINRSMSFLQDNHNVDSSKENNILYSKMNNIVGDYYSAQRELMEKLDYEAKLVKYAAESYFNLDRDIEKEADRL